jgi:hypothetical protein
MKKLILCCLVVCLVSCEHKKIYHYLQEPLLTAATLKQGSYFIYRDSISGAEDSVWVANFSNEYYGIDELEAKVEHYYQEIHIRLEDTSGLFMNITYAVSGHPNIEAKMVKIGFSILAYMPFEINKNIQTDVYSGYLLQYYSTLQIRNKIYKHVYEIDNRLWSAGKTDTQYFHSFYSGDSGLVKFRTKFTGSDMEVWELVRSRIIR